MLHEAALCPLTYNFIVRAQIQARGRVQVQTCLKAKNSSSSPELGLELGPILGPVKFVFKSSDDDYGLPQYCSDGSTLHTHTWSSSNQHASQPTMKLQLARRTLILSPTSVGSCMTHLRGGKQNTRINKEGPTPFLSRLREKSKVKRHHNRHANSVHFSVQLSSALSSVQDSRYGLLGGRLDLVSDRSPAAAESRPITPYSSNSVWQLTVKQDCGRINLPLTSYTILRNR